MIVRVRLFAALRERAGTDRLELELPDGAVVADALAAVDDLAAGLPLVLAVNREYAAADQVLHPDDELAVVPPVSGGSAHLHTAVVEHALSLDALVSRVQDPRAGAVVTFSGVTRDVAFLDYDGYVEMAELELRRIVEEAVAAHGLCAAAAEHRTGRVAIAEASILVAASAPHRPAAFAGARQIIDQVKERLPIWKQEEGIWKHDHVPPTAAS
ncbi:MAG: molybdenum cofactor biosynthesis protein MoaE [Actinomycetota bacterium]|nr:molybdenum cofactor biosynthesis protein MoaE [Actinomycetota bacterium]